MSSLKSFFNPKSVAVVGVSSNPSKLGSVVFQNMLDAGYEGELIAVNPKNAGKKFNGKPCVAKVSDILKPLDLVVIVVPVQLVNSIVNDCIANKTRNISIITAGFSEVGNHELEKQIYAKCIDAGISVLGPNCLGHISTFNKVNASFADGFPLQGNVAFISQSGAFCSAMMDWAEEKKIGFSHFISIGNKAHLSEVELLNAIKKDKNTTAFVFYLESLKDGQRFLRVVSEISNTKPVVVMEPGKSSKAQMASLSHTGSLAPNYRVLQLAYEKAGAIQAYSTREMFGLLEILQYVRNNEFDGNFAIVTNAGGVGVLSSDLCEDNDLNLTKPSNETIEKLKRVLPSEASLGNPIDLVGDAKADRYEATLKILCESGEYKNVLVLLTPQMTTDVEGTAEIIAKFDVKYKNVNIFASFIGGSRVRKGINILKEKNSIHFDYPADGIRLLGLLKKQMAHRYYKNVEIVTSKVPAEIKDAIAKHKTARSASLPQELVNKIMDYYGLDYPKSGNFINKKEGLAFCKKLFPAKVVLKLSTPDILHKTEMKGVYLGIDDEEKFNKTWDKLYDLITESSLKNANILIQEMISNKHETIIGVSSDKNFGRIMIFGTGGIYTEIIKDITLRVLPTKDFKKMIAETKIGTILNGARGENPMAVKQLTKTLEKIQKLVLELPEIVTVDANPVLVTKNRVVIVDFKMML
ncbi:acetate--CoA ligase family protein [Pseudomonadota bacterium]